MLGFLHDAGGFYAKLNNFVPCRVVVFNNYKDAREALGMDAAAGRPLNDFERERTLGGKRGKKTMSESNPCSFACLQPFLKFFYRFD